MQKRTLFSISPVMALILSMPLLGPSASFASSPNPSGSDALTAQIQEDGKVRVFEGLKEIANVMPEIFLKNWKIVFFSDSGAEGTAEAQAKLPDGNLVDFKVSAKATASGLNIHGVMTPRKDIQVLSAREVVYSPYDYWEGDPYDFGKHQGSLPHEVLKSDGGIIAHGEPPLVLGPSHTNGLTMKFTSKLIATLQDARQWTPAISVYFDQDKSTNQVWNWNAGENKIFDLTLAFNGKILVKAVEPPKDLKTLTAQIDQAVKPYIEGKWCPGLAIGLIYQGQTWIEGYGTTSLAGGKPPDGDTEYEIGSITKLFTKLLFSDMVHQGLMGITDKAQTYLPTGVKMPSKDGQDITLLMLSNHTSQLPHDPDDVLWNDPYHNPESDYSLDRLYAFLNHYQLTAAPGGNFQYSNTGVALLGDFAAQRKGISWIDYLQARVLGPVGLKDTGVVWTQDQLSRAAQGYDGELDPLPLWKWEKPTFMPAGSLHSTVKDLLKLAQTALDPKSSPLSDIAFDDTSRKLDWGERVGHDGQTSGFNCSFFVDRKNKTAVVVLGDCGNLMTSKAAGAIRNLAQGFLPAETDLPTFTQLPLSELSKYTGRFHVVKTPAGWAQPKEDDLFEINNGKLYSKANQNQKHDLEIEPLTDGNFYTRYYGMEVVFTRDSEGNVTGYALKDFPDYVAEKVGYKSPMDKAAESIPPPP